MNEDEREGTDGNVSPDKVAEIRAKAMAATEATAALMAVSDELETQMLVDHLGLVLGSSALIEVAFSTHRNDPYYGTDLIIARVLAIGHACGAAAAHGATAKAESDLAAELFKGSV